MREERVEEYSLHASQEDDQSLTLPRDIYPNKFLYQISRHRAPLFATSLELVLCTLLIRYFMKKNDSSARFEAVSSVVSFGLPLGLSLFSGMVHLVHNCGKAPVNRVRFMEEIIAVEPGTETRKWDSIAARLNAIFYSNNSLATPHFFYDGNACYFYFRLHYVRPLFEKKESSYAFREFPDEFKALIHQAMEAYKKGLDKDWQRLLNTGSSLGIRASTSEKMT